jgi:predicted HTH transcriptional regulator
MANTAGGVLLIGVEENGERAIGIPGIALENGDRDPMERYERMLRDRIEPPIQGIQIKSIPVGKDGNYVIAIGVPTSMSRPHRTKVSGEGSGRGRWAIRRNKNTDDMTYSEIRGAFLDLADIEARVRQFHAARINVCSRSTLGSMRIYRGAHELGVQPAARCEFEFVEC